MTEAEKVNVLISYHYVQGRPLRETLDRELPGEPVRVFVDSGAFSAKMLGAEITVGEYGRWVSRSLPDIHTYVNLDVIGHGKESAEETWRNHRTLEDDHGLKPLPVFHLGEPWEYLERYLEGGHRYICLGGLVGGSAKTAMPWLVRCFRMAGGAAVFHGFGMTRTTLLRALPWYSVDSSSWLGAGRWGGVPVFDSQAGRFYNLTAKSTQTERARIAPALRRLGFSLSQIEFPSAPSERTVQRTQVWNPVSAASQVSLARWAQRLHGEVRVPGDESTPAGPLVYLAGMSSWHDARVVVPAVRKGTLSCVM